MGTSRRARKSRRFLAALLASTALSLAPGAAGAETVFSLFQPKRFYADEEDFFSSGDYGGVGLLQTRTARFGPDGQFDFGASSVDEYRRFYLNWHALPWLEATFRFTEIRNRLFSDDPDFSGNQTFKDRGADLKFKLVDESAYRPAVAVGLQDSLGTGKFAGEYLVASKRWFDLDFHFGLGWGYFTGRHGGVDNPMVRLFGDSFRRRDSGPSTGGTPNFGQWFAGERMALFGGLEWRTPIEGLALKLEYDPNDYQAEPLGNRFEQKTPWNVGMVYRPFAWFDTSLGFERGTKLMWRAAVRANLAEFNMQKFLDTPPPALKPRPAPAPAPETTQHLELEDTAPSDPADPVDAFFGVLEREGLVVEAVELTESAARIVIAGGAAGTDPLADRDRAVRAAGAAARLLPVPLDRVTFVAAEAGGGLREVTVDRAEIDRLSVVDRLFEGLAAEGYRVEGFEFSHDEARLQVTRHDGRTDLVADRRAARLVAAAVPAPVRNVTLVRMSAGIEADRMTISREDIGRAEPVDALFDALEGDGFAVEWVELSRRRATVHVTAPAGGGSERRMAAAARRIARLGALPADAVTLVSRRSGAAARRLTVTAAGIIVAEDGRGAGGRGGARPPLSDAERQAAAGRIFAELARAGFRGEAVHLTESHATVYLTPARYRDSGRNIGRPARIVANNTPASVEAISIAMMSRGAELSRVTLLRRDLEQAVAWKGSPEEVWANALGEGGGGPTLPPGAIANPDRYPGFSWNLEPRYRQSVGGPDGFVLYQVYAALSGRLEPIRGLRLSATLAQNIVDSFDELKQESNSELPRVRSDIAKYLREGTSGIENLYADYVFSPHPEWYVKLTGGLLEKMYAGIAGEVLFRPFDSRLALGLEVAEVRQRDFDADFGLRDYRITTGHLGIYYDMPFYGLRGEIQTGRYLAGDVGATFQLSRRFDTGVVLGAFFTLTDVSFDEFGEGSFDKGFFMTFPFDMFLPSSSRRRGVFAFRPLTRDGGQRVIVPDRLYLLTEEGNLGHVGRGWHRLLE